MQKTKADKAQSAAKAALAARIQEKKSALGTHHAPEKKPLFSSSDRIKKLKTKEVIKMSRGLSSMLRANINTSDAIGYYASGHPNAEIRKTLEEIREQIDGGVPPYTAFEKTGKFEGKFISLVRAGCDSGQLGKAFESIAKTLKKEAEFKSKMKKATLVPSVIIFALICLFIGAQLSIIPQIEKMLSDMKQEPDTITGILFKISHVVKKTWVFIIGGILGSIFTFIFVEKIRTSVVYFLMSKWRLLRNLIMGMRQLLFLGSLEMLYANGINLSRAVEISAESLKGTPMFNELIQAGQRYIETGLPFSEAIRKFTSCDPQVAHLIAIGEKSSSLGDQLHLLNEMYEEDVANIVVQFTGVVNILVMLIAVLLIGAVFIGAFLPIFLMGPKMMNASM